MLLFPFLFLSPLLLPPTLPPAAQQADADSELLIEYYKPKHAPAAQLESTLQQIHGVGSLPSFMTFGKTLIIRARTGDMAKALEVAERLDAAWVREDEAGAPLASLEYRTRYMPLDSLRSALLPFSHPIRLEDQYGSTSLAGNISYVEERALVLVRDTAQAIAEIEALLKRIDVPQPQVQITCYLLEGRLEAKEDPRVPQELVRDLSKLVPFAGFELLSYGSFRSDALSGVQMEETLPGGGNFQLLLFPKAFEPSVRTLTFEKCQFLLMRQGPQKDQSKTFTTSARVRLDEYTVLGALGSDPVFVVLRVTLLEG